MGKSMRRALDLTDFFKASTPQNLVYNRSASNINDHRSKLLSKIFNYLDFDAIVTIVAIPIFQIHFLAIVGLESLDIDFSSVLYSTKQGNLPKEAFRDTSEMRIRDHYSLSLYRSSQSIATFWSVFANVIVLDVSYCRSITDDDLEVVMSCKERTKGLVSLCFAGCPLITKNTLSVIDRTQIDLILLSFTIPDISFDILFRILGTNTKLKRVRCPDYEFPGLQIAEMFPTVSFESRLAPSYGEFVKEIHSMSFCPAIIEPVFSKAPIITALTGKGEDNEDIMLFDPDLLKALKNTRIDSAKIGNHTFLLTALIVANDLESFKKCIENIETPYSLLPYFLHAIEIVGISLLKILSPFIEVVIFRQNYLDLQWRSKSSLRLLDFHSQISTNHQTVQQLAGSQSGNNFFCYTTLSDIFIKHHHLATIMAKHEIGVRCGRDVVSVFEYYFFSKPNRLMIKQLVQSRVDINVKSIAKIFSLDFWDEEILDMLEVILDSSANHVCTYVDPRGNTLLHLLALKPHSNINSLELELKFKKIVTHFKNQISSIVYEKNLAGHTPVTLSYRFGNWVYLEVLKYVFKAIEYPIDATNILWFCKQASRTTIGGTADRALRELLPLCNLNSITDQKILSKLLTANQSKIDKVLSCQLVHCLVEYPSYLDLFLQSHDNNNAIIEIKMAGDIIKFSLIDFALDFRLSETIILSILRNAKLNISIQRPILHQWLEIHFNLFLRAIPGLLSFADLDSDLQDYLPPPKDTNFPIISENILRKQNLFQVILDHLPLTFLLDNLSSCHETTPISFHLIHLWCLEQTIKIPLYLNAILMSSDCVSIHDRLGNSLVHILARFSPQILFPVAIKNSGFDLKKTNNKGETAILYFIKSVEIDSMVDNIVDDYLTHPSLRALGSPTSILEVDDLNGNNCLTIALCRDVVANGNCLSLLSEHMIILFKDLDKRLFLHKLVNNYPYVYVYESMSEEKIVLGDISWKRLIGAYQLMGVDLNCLIMGQTILDIIIKYAPTSPVITLLKFMGCCTGLEIEPERMIVDNAHTTKLHTACLESPDIVLAIIKSHPESILVADSQGRLPLHLYSLGNNKDSHRIHILKALLGPEEDKICRIADSLGMTPLMCSLVADIMSEINGLSEVSKYLVSLDYIECPQISESRNAAFVIIQHISDWSCNHFIAKENKSVFCTRPEKLILILKSWATHCGLDMELVDENGDTLLDYWYNFMSESGISMMIAAAIKKGLASLNAKSASQLMDEECVNHESIDDFIELEQGPREHDFLKGARPTIKEPTLPPMHVKPGPSNRDKAFTIRKDLGVVKGMVERGVKSVMIKIEQNLVETVEAPLDRQLQKADRSPTVFLPLKRVAEPIGIIALQDETNNRAVRQKFPGLSKMNVPISWSEVDVASGEVLSTKPYKVINEVSLDIEANNLSNTYLKIEDGESLSQSDSKNRDISDSENNGFIEKNNYDVETAELFKAASQANTLRIVALVNDGAEVTALNSESQYPIHLWCLKIAITVDPKTRILPGMEHLLPQSSRKITINHLDCHYCTPLSIIIAQSVWSWSIRTGLHNPKYVNAAIPDIKHVYIKRSCVLSTLLRLGANLSGRRDGLTAFHGMAMTVYANKDSVVPGYKAQNKLFVLPAALIVQNFRDIGKCDLNVTDCTGRTGLDILIERHRNHKIFLSDADFDVFLDYLDKIGCRRANFD